MASTDNEDKTIRLWDVTSGNRRNRHGFQRHGCILETLDLLCEAFGTCRAGHAWTTELARMQKWLQRDDRSRLSALG